MMIECESCKENHESRNVFGVVVFSLDVSKGFTETNRLETNFICKNCINASREAINIAPLK